MVSSILRRISEKAATIANVRGLMDPAKNPPLRGLSNLATKPPNTSISSSPWLMLPPAFEGNDNNIMAFNFYSFADKKDLKFCNERVGILVNDLNNIKFVSSSHGWLALFNRRNCDLFLYNPLSGRQIKLPPIHTLSIHKVNLKLGHWCVTKLITSCSPEEEDCLVMLSFGPHQRLAFCSPTSSEWTPIGDLYYEDSYGLLIQRRYVDFVYSRIQKRFYCITNADHFESWDLHDTGSPKILEMKPPYYVEMEHLKFPYNELELDEDEMDHPIGAQTEDELELKKECSSIIFLVVAEDSGDLFWIRRYLMQYMFDDGAYAYQFDGDVLELPYKTIGFDVHKYDPEKDALVYMDGSLDGLALFIGNNHSFAISASESPELEPNSIYFTDVNIFIPPSWRRLPFGGHDLGIFNYENKGFSSTCYYPCDRESVNRIIPPPMWFSPTR